MKDDEIRKKVIEDYGEHPVELKEMTRKLIRAIDLTISLKGKQDEAEIKRLRKYHKEQIEAIQKKIGKDVSEL